MIVTAPRQPRPPCSIDVPTLSKGILCLFNAEFYYVGIELILCEFRHEYETTLENYPPESRHVLKLQVREKMPSPRIIQTHLPFYLLHPDLLETSKVNGENILSKRRKSTQIIFLLIQIIYVARNPKDVIVSYFYLCKLYKVVHDYQGTLEQFADYFMNNEGLSTK